jgi:hypothetical protein
MRPEQSPFERVQLLRKPPPPDEEVLPTDDETASNDGATRRRGVLGFAAFIIAMVIIGAVLAVVWHKAGAQLWAGLRLWPAFASQPTSAAGSGAPDQQLDGIARELASLKARIGELGAAQQQMAASIAALQAVQQQLRAAQQEFGQPPGVPQGGPAWFSSAVMLGGAAGQNPAAGTPLQPPRSAPPRTNAQAPNARTPNASPTGPRP